MIELDYMEIKVLENQSIYFKGKKENVFVNPNEGDREDSKYPSRIFLFTAEKYDGICQLHHNDVYFDAEVALYL